MDVLIEEFDVAALIDEVAVGDRAADGQERQHAAWSTARPTWARCAPT